MQPYNEINIEMRDDVMLWDIRGDITAFSEPHLNEAYRKAIDQGARNILFKIEEGAYVNSGGIAILLQLLAQTKINNQRVGITGVSDHNTKIFSMLGINKFAKLYPSVENALELLTKKD